MTHAIPAAGTEQKQSIDEALRRPARHWSVDGLAEMIAGSLVLLWGGAIIPQQLWPSKLTDVLALYVPALGSLALLVFYGRLTRAIEAIKARWIYPRVGYVKVHGPSRGRKLAVGVLAVVVAGGMAAVLGRSAAWQSLMPLAMGAEGAAAAALIWLRLGLGRLLLYALLALGCGIVAQLLLPPHLGVGVVMCAIGASWLLGGVIVLRGILRQPPVEELQ